MDPLEAALQDACGEDPTAVCEWVFERTDSALLANLVDWLLARPLKILLIVIVAWVVNRLVRRGIKRFTRRMANPDQATFARLSRYTPTVLLPSGQVNLRSASRAETLGSVLRSAASVLIWGMAILTILGELEINLGPLIAGAGIAGIALGFGAQSLVKDFLSGTFMLIEDQFGVGDIVDLGPATGVVEGMTLRSTRIRSVDGAVWHVPNGEILRVCNKSQQWSRALLDIEVTYGTDLRHARVVIKRVADEVHSDPEWAGVILEPPEVLGVEDMRADGIALRLSIKTRPGEQWALQRALREKLKYAFDEEGIEIPFPQRTVWIKGSPGEDGTLAGTPPDAEPGAPGGD